MTSSSARLEQAIEYAESYQRGYLDNLGNTVIDQTGRYDGKYESGTVSLASHLVNSTVVGLNTYLYEKIVIRGESVTEDDVRVLTAALSLHDVNKIVSNTTDEEYLANTEETLQEYFEDDLLDIEDYVVEGEENIDEYFDDLLYLIQRTETGENATQTRGISTDYSGLEAYCEIGDGVTSAVTAGDLDDGYERLNRMFSHTDESHVHKMSFNRTNRPLLSSLVLTAVQDVIEGKGDSEPKGLIVGSTTTEILYLGEEIDRDVLRKHVRERVKTELASGRFSIGCKADWQSVNYGALKYIGIELDEKRRIIRNEYADTTLHGGQAGIGEIESVPDTLLEVLPEILHRTYNVKDYDFTSEAVQTLWDETKDEVGGAKSKVHFIANLCREFETYEEYIDEIVADYDEELRDVLVPEKSPSENIIDEFFGDLLETEVVSGADSCFLCGKPASSEYTGDTLYSTNAFSKRVGVEQKYKNACRACRSEEAMLQSVVRDSEQINDDIAMVMFYYDDFVANIRPSVNVEEVNILDNTISFDDDETGLGAVSLVAPQVHIQPLSLSSGPNESDSNKKIRVVREILKKVQSTGMKATITTPFRPFTTERPVFRDLNPIGRQEAFGIAEIEEYNDLERALSLLQIGHEISGANPGRNSPYLQIERDSFIQIAHSAIRDLDEGHRRESVKNYTTNYKTESYMQMKEVAEHGFELYRTGFNDSKHKKTSVFREAIESVMTGLHRDMNRKDIAELTGGRVMTAANRQQDSGYEVSVDDVEDFVESLLKYLEDNGFLDIQRLSDGKNHIVDAYYFTYEQVLSEQYGDNNDN